MPRSIICSVPEELNGEKLIVFLRGHLKISARLLPKLKSDPMGLLRNGEHIRTIDRVFTGDEITVTFPDEENAIPPSDTENLNIIYEDEDIIVINKSPDIAMHPTHNHQGDTLANKISAYLSEKNRQAVFRAVGRLDKCTSGLVIIALNAHAANILSENVEKHYIAIAGGEYHGEGTINKPIVRPDPGKTYRWVGEGGEYAVTHWKSLKTDGKRSVVKIHLETGRTHQIRVHFASMGTPLAGDDMYGSEDLSISRAALHCFSLKFLHPVTKEEMYLEAPLPDDMQSVADTIE
ncbi:MAG: RluA family pseudouridine synthase [Clostridia bacterium]|nr:RluA family pseudouridine synthase [Clostridia bacterium]